MEEASFQGSQQSRAPLFHRRLGCPKLSWGMTGPPRSASGARSAVRSSQEDLSGNLIVQLGVSSSAAEPALVRTQRRPSPQRGPAPHASVRSSVGSPPPLTAWSKTTGAVFEAKFMLQS